jgi:hypothetical protein
VVRAYAQK